MRPGWKCFCLASQVLRRLVALLTLLFQQLKIEKQRLTRIFEMRTMENECGSSGAPTLSATFLAALWPPMLNINSIRRSTL
jgi:hypothetical protein